MSTNLLWGLLVAGVGAAAGAFAMVDVVGAKVHRAQAVNEARSIADMADNVGTWASTYKGVWIKDDGLTEKGVDIGSRSATSIRAKSPILMAYSIPITARTPR
jgi:hypothetical protein